MTRVNLQPSAPNGLFMRESTSRSGGAAQFGDGGRGPGRLCCPACGGLLENEVGRAQDPLPWDIGLAMNAWRRALRAGLCYEPMGGPCWGPKWPPNERTGR